MEELTEVITAAEFHPINCNEFVYSSSKGSIRLCDMRTKALCDQHAKSESVLLYVYLTNQAAQVLVRGGPSGVWGYLFFLMCLGQTIIGYSES